METHPNSVITNALSLPFLLQIAGSGQDQTSLSGSRPSLTSLSPGFLCALRATPSHLLLHCLLPRPGEQPCAVATAPRALAGSQPGTAGNDPRRPSRTAEG